MKYVRKQLNWILRQVGVELQKQAHDHVLREEDRERDAFINVAAYIRMNPLRARLVEGEECLRDYPYLGCVVPGYPELSIWDRRYWDRFWKIYWATVAEEDQRSRKLK